jgi:predicted dehydrogenase
VNLTISTILRSIQFLALGTWLVSILYFSCAVAPARARSLRPTQAQQTQEGSTHDQQSASETNPPGTDPDWRKGLLRMANGVTKDGFAFSQNTYRGTDGENLYFEIFHYRSAERAKNEFDTRVKDAPHVIERRKKLDDNGQVSAELAVLSVDIDGKKPTAMIVIVSEDTFRDVRSDSLDDILRIAKKLKP